MPPSFDYTRDDLIDALRASGLGPGLYRVELFIAAQYVDREGKSRILNSSAQALEVGR